MVNAAAAVSLDQLKGVFTSHFQTDNHFKETCNKFVEHLKPLLNDPTVADAVKTHADFHIVKLGDNIPGHTVLNQLAG